MGFIRSRVFLSKHYKILFILKERYVHSQGGDDMKKIVFLGLILLLVASSTGFSQNIPLPKEIVIKAPSPELPKEIAAFSGKWKGKWDGQVDFIVVVTEINSEKAEITYANAEYPSRKWAAVCVSETAKVIPGGKPKIQFNRTIQFSTGMVGSEGWYTFEMQKDLKTLKGVVEYPQSTCKATLEKIQ
jgi:hypothetical protein